MSVRKSQQIKIKNKTWRVKWRGECTGLKTVRRINHVTAFQKKDAEEFFRKHMIDRIKEEMDLEFAEKLHEIGSRDGFTILVSNIKQVEVDQFMREAGYKPLL